jgi:N-acetylglucosaminyldiphosphoundecaprenol N-acetyl-beta-D-mannosaminyltransferase
MRNLTSTLASGAADSPPKPHPVPLSGSLAGEPARPLELPVPITMLGVPFDRVTTADSLRLIGQMIASGRPHYAATANVDFAVQALADVELRRILSDADLVLCDGMPLVWASRFLGNPLPERVAGSDLVPQMLAEAERQGWRVFFLGGAEQSVARAAANIRARHPQLQLVGSYSPPFKPLLEMDHEDIVQRVRAARPDILLVAFGCPKQEKWIGMQFRHAGVPLSIGVGATIDFLGGSMRRAPQWMQRTGLEWMFRLLQEPRRLFRRYLTDFWVFGRLILRQWWRLHGVRSSAQRPSGVAFQSMRSGVCEIVRFEERLNTATVQQHAELWPRLAASPAHLLLDVSGVQFIDSTGVGLLLRLQKHFRAAGRQLVLIAPTKPVLRAFALMGLAEFFLVAGDLPAARALIDERIAEPNVVVTKPISSCPEPLVWQGDIGAANAEEVWSMTRVYLEHSNDPGAEVRINLAGVRFIDTTGVRLMVRTRKEALRRGVQLKFTEPSPAVLNVLRILQMDRSLLS